MIESERKLLGNDFDYELKKTNEVQMHLRIVQYLGDITWFCEFYLYWILYKGISDHCFSVRVLDGYCFIENYAQKVYFLDLNLSNSQLLVFHLNV